MVESRTGLKFKQSTFNSNSCSNFTHRTSKSCLNHSQEPCRWVDANLGVLWVESEQKLHLKVGFKFQPRSRFGCLPRLVPTYPHNSENWRCMIDFQMQLTSSSIYFESGKVVVKSRSLGSTYLICLRTLWTNTIIPSCNSGLCNRVTYWLHAFLYISLYC